MATSSACRCFADRGAPRDLIKVVRGEAETAASRCATSVAMQRTVKDRSRPNRDRGRRAPYPGRVQKLTDKFIGDIDSCWLIKRKTCLQSEQTGDPVLRDDPLETYGRKPLRCPAHCPSSWMAMALGEAPPVWPRVAGHRKGVETLRGVIRACADRVCRIDVFAFSSGMETVRRRKSRC